MNRYELGPIGTNCYVVRAHDRAHEAVVVDPGADAPRILEELATLESTCAAILITHGHWDHLGGVAELAQATGAPVYMADDERLLLEDVNSFTPPGVELQPYSPDVALQGDEVLELAGMSFETLRVPGHSPAHLAYHTEGCGLLRRPPLRRFGRPHGPSRGRLGHARRVDPDACGPVPAGHDRLLGSRTGDDDRRGARSKSVSRGAARVTRFEAPRGTHDILPSEQPLWEWVTGEMKDVASLYGYGRIDTPAFEDTDLIVRTSGGGSDVVQKETYTFTDRGDRSLTLRPEATAPICRAYVQHGLQREPQPQKLYTIGPMWRYDRPQRGRYREHWQLSIEAIGTDDPAIDAEVIQLYAELLRRVGVTDYVLELNSIGDQNCRPAYIEQLAAWLDEHEQELDDEARAKRATSPLRVFDVKSERVQALLAGAPKIGESLCAACREHFERVREYLDTYGVRYELTPTLVRGLDYYTRTTFEFKDEAIGAKDTICGGGRYDGLIEAIGGPPTPGIGFGAGIERLLLSIGAERAAPAHADVFFVFEEGADRARVLPLLAELRRRGLRADMDYAGRSVKGQLTQAGRLGAGWTVIVNGGQATVRESGRPDVTASLDELVDRISG